MTATFSPAAPSEIGPNSNTGQKSDPGRGAIIDYLTFVVPVSKLVERNIDNINWMLRTILDAGCELVATGLREKAWQFYRMSAYIHDRAGQLVGRIGIDGNGDTLCVSLSGEGCKHVGSWYTVHHELRNNDARITRLDVAYDDYDGRILDVHSLRAQAHEGAFTSGGRPPQLRFLSDEGSGKGSTLYVGAKGHKECCVYEKGKQLGMPSSPWVRAEVRLYGKHIGGSVPLDALLRPLDYLRGSYPIFESLLDGIACAIRTVREKAKACAHAMQAWMRNQCGRSINLLIHAMGDSWPDYVEACIRREGLPARFADLQGDHLFQSVRQQLCASS